MCILLFFKKFYVFYILTIELRINMNGWIDKLLSIFAVLIRQCSVIEILLHIVLTLFGRFFLK